MQVKAADSDPAIEAIVKAKAITGVAVIEAFVAAVTAIVAVTRVAALQTDSVSCFVLFEVAKAMIGIYQREDYQQVS